MRTLDTHLLGQYRKDLDQASRQLFELGRAAFEVRQMLRHQPPEGVLLRRLAVLDRVLAKLPPEYRAAYEENE